jgi:hypothetical protein
MPKNDNKPLSWMDIDRPTKDIYDDRPPLNQTKLIRRKKESFKDLDEANKWALDNFKIVEELHTARVYCWRVKN